MHCSKHAYLQIQVNIINKKLSIYFKCYEINILSCYYFLSLSKCQKKNVDDVLKCSLHNSANKAKLKVLPFLTRILSESNRFWTGSRKYFKIYFTQYN